MRKLLVALLLGLGLAGSANASIIIQFEQLNITYDRTGFLSAELFDGGVPGPGDAVTNVRFINVDDVTLAETLIGQLADAQVDFHFDILPITSPVGVIVGQSQYFNITSGAYFLNLGQTGLLGVGGLVAGPNVSSVTLANAPLVSQFLPFNITISDPVNFALSGHITGSTVGGIFLPVFSDFTATATGSVTAPGEVPEPGILSLLAIGLLGLGFARRATKRG